MFHPVVPAEATRRASLVPDASSCIGNRRLHSDYVLSEIDANDDKHHSTIPDEPSNDVHAVGRLIEISQLVHTVYNSGSLTETKPQSKLKLCHSYLWHQLQGTRSFLHI